MALRDESGNSLLGWLRVKGRVSKGGEGLLGGGGGKRVCYYAYSKRAYILWFQYKGFF